MTAAAKAVLNDARDALGADSVAFTEISATAAVIGFNRTVKK